MSDKRPPSKVYRNVSRVGVKRPKKALKVSPVVASNFGIIQPNFMADLASMF